MNEEMDERDEQECESEVGKLVRHRVSQERKKTRKKNEVEVYIN